MIAASLVLGVWTFDSKLSLSGDNAAFIIQARSLAQGEGLSHINSPEPRPSTQVPFGFPLFLAPLAWAFPDDWVPMKALVLALFALGMGVLYQLARERVGVWPALAVVALSLMAGKSYLTHGETGETFGPTLLHYAHQVMSEIPFLTFSLLALWLVDRGVKREGIRHNGWLLGGMAFAIWAYYVRTAGIALAAALAAHLLLRRDYRAASSLWARHSSAGCLGLCATMRWAAAASISSSSSWSTPTVPSRAGSTFIVPMSA